MSGKVDREGCPRGAINSQQYQLATITVSLQKSRICSFSLASKTVTTIYLTLNSQILLGKLPTTLMQLSMVSSRAHEYMLFHHLRDLALRSWLYVCLMRSPP
jgi:hypothetical protein